jgi:hypothetical protein
VRRKKPETPPRLFDEPEYVPIKHGPATDAIADLLPPWELEGAMLPVTQWPLEMWVDLMERWNIREFDGRQEQGAMDAAIKEVWRRYNP